MKKLCTLLLLFLLALQSSWAVAGAYCTHERSGATQHFGHHIHVHQPQIDDNDSKSPLQQHPDCSSCHAVTLGLGESDVGLLNQPRRPVTLPLPDLPLSSAPPAEPERPKWVTAA